MCVCTRSANYEETCRSDGENTKNRRKVECVWGERWCEKVYRRKELLCTENFCRSHKPTKDQKYCLEFRAEHWREVIRMATTTRPETTRLREWTRPNFEVKRKIQIYNTIDSNCLQLSVVTFHSNDDVSFVHNERATEVVWRRILNYENRAKGHLTLIEVAVNSVRKKNKQLFFPFFVVGFCAAEFHVGLEGMPSNPNETIDDINPYVDYSKTKMRKFYHESFRCIHWTEWIREQVKTLKRNALILRIHVIELNRNTRKTKQMNAKRAKLMVERTYPRTNNSDMCVCTCASTRTHAQLLFPAATNYSFPSLNLNFAAALLRSHSHDLFAFEIIYLFFFFFMMFLPFLVRVAPRKRRQHQHYAWISQWNVIIIFRLIFFRFFGVHFLLYTHLSPLLAPRAPLHCFRSHPIIFRECETKHWRNWEKIKTKCTKTKELHARRWSAASTERESVDLTLHLSTLLST